MKIDIITIFPELLSSPFEHSILKRAIAKNLVEVNFINLRDYSTSKHKNVDDYAFGGGPGMIMMIEPVYNCINYLKSKKTYDEIIYTSPDGEMLTQPVANELSLKGNLIILCGHYKGIDERIRENLITREISIGNYVLSGGELAAMVICDAVIRLIPGVLNDGGSALSDSFQDGLIAPPVYTRPAKFNNWAVPEILLSGDEKLINAWKYAKSLERTKKRRPGLTK